MTTTTISSKFNRHNSPEIGGSFGGFVPLRMRVAIHRDALTRELAAGAPPELSPELGLRAAQLVSPRARRQVARTWRGTVKEAHQPPLTRAYFSIIRRNAVINAEDAINAVVARLTSGQPVSRRGNGEAPPAHDRRNGQPALLPAEPGALRRQIVLATQAMDPQQPDELALAA